MQRRVAAIYFALFLVLGAGAYSVIAVAQQPTIDVEGEPLAAGDSVTVNGEQFTVASISEENASDGGGTTIVGQLATTNDSYVYSATLANGSGLSPGNSSWPGKAAEFTATIDDGQTVAFNGSQQTANISAGTFALENEAGNRTESFSAGDSFPYEGNTTTITNVSDTAATLVWGDNYEVVIANVSAPDEFRAVQQFNVTERLQDDPEVENQVFQGDDGRFVRYRNGTTQPLADYLPARDSARFAEGDTLTFRAGSGVSAPANETTIANVSTGGVLLEWTGSRTTTTELTEGSNVTLAGEQRVVHFRDSSTLILSDEVVGYRDQVRTQNYFEERMNGLWGISILSGFAGIVIIGLAYLPSRG
jgi:hypothetical protein